MIQLLRPLLLILTSDSGTVPVSSPVTVPPKRPIDLHIALRIDERSTTNPHPVYNFLSYN